MKKKTVHPVLLEDLDDKLDRVLDIVSGTNERVTRIEKKLDRIEPVVALIPTIQTAIKEQTNETKDHERRLGRLEHKAA